MPARHPPRPRQRQPELEHDLSRSPLLGYEPPAETGLVRLKAKVKPFVPPESPPEVDDETGKA